MKSICENHFADSPEFNIIEKEIIADDYGIVTVYGISARFGDDVCEQHDISADRGMVENIIRVMKEHGVSRVHFYDVIEDMLP